MKRKQLLVILVIVSMAVASLIARGAAENSSEPFLVYTDTTGATTSLETSPIRIVSLGPNITETIYALGQGGKLVGRTDYCDFPAQALEVPSVGDLYNVSIEKIAAIGPDAVICSSIISQDTIQAIRNLGIPVLVLNMQETIEGTYKLIADVGAMLDAADEADREIAGMKKTIAEVSAKAGSEAPVSIYYVIGYGEYGDYTATGDTYINGIIEAAGGDNIAKDGQYWSYSREQLVNKDPSVIVFSATAYSNFENDVLFFRTNEPYCNLTAVKEGRVFKIDGNLMERQGPRTAEAVRQLAAMLHPDLFLLQ